MKQRLRLPRSQGLSSSCTLLSLQAGGKVRDPGNEVETERGG